MLVTLPSSKVLPQCELVAEQLELCRQLLVAEHVERYNTAQLRRLLVRARLAQPKLIDDKHVLPGPFDTEAWQVLSRDCRMLTHIRELANLASEIHLNEKEVLLLGL